MSLRFRNLDVDPEDPVEQWGPEGILTAIDRGGLADWRRITSALRSDPYGPVSADVEQVLDLAEDRGAARVIALALERARMTEAQRVGWRIKEYVWRSGLSQAEFARRIGTSPSRMSTYVAGTVTPSAVLLERMRRLAEAARQ